MRAEFTCKKCALAYEAPSSHALCPTVDCPTVNIAHTVDGKPAVVVRELAQRVEH